MNNMSKKQEIIGLIDADLLDNGTRHPNLVLLKLAGFFHDNGIPFELILDPQANTLHYTRIYLSCVFTFTKLPELYIRSKGTPEEKKFKCGGTGFYANEVINEANSIISKKSCVSRETQIPTFFHITNSIGARFQNCG